MDVVRALADRIIVLHNGKLVADGEPADGDRLADRAGGLSRRRRSPHELSILLQLAGVHTHIGPYHILHGVDFAVPAGGLTMLLGRNGAGKTTTLRTIMGLWQASAGSIRFDGRDITKRRDARDRARRHRLRAGEHGHLRRPHGAREPGAGGAQRARSTRTGSSGSSAVSRAEEVLEPAGRQAVRRAEADARDRARDRRAAPAAADRRADQGPRARDRAQHDRGLPRAEGRGETILLVEQNFHVARRSATTSR